MKLRSDCALTDLTDEQRDDLFEWLASGMSFRDASAKAALPGPEGFAIPIHPTTLWRWFPRERARRHLEALADAKTSGLLQASPDELAKAAKIEFAHALFQAATSPDSAASFSALSRAFHRLEIEGSQRDSLALQQQRLQLERERHLEQIRQFELDVLAVASQHAVKLVEIGHDNSLSNLQKGARARKVIFPGKGQLPQTIAPSTNSQ